MKYLSLYLILINVVAFILYGLDKRKARHDQWRISERTLIGVALIGGSVGAALGMYVFHHKTKHWYFRFGIPLIFLIQVMAIWLIYKGFKW